MSPRAHNVDRRGADARSSAYAQSPQAIKYGGLPHALLAAGLVLIWWIATVHFNFGGNWSALFYTGTGSEAARALPAEQMYLFPNRGWDGQYYHLVAHDPFLRGDLGRAVEAPRLRYRRILVPLAAWLLAAGDSRLVDIAYRTVILAFVFLGAYWLGRIAASAGRPVAWGLTFCILPATVVSVDRMGVDIGLMALCCGFVLYAARPDERRVRMFLLLVCAALARDTGLLLIAAWCAWLLFERRWARALIDAAAALPAVAWYAYVAGRTPRMVYFSAPAVPFSGLADRFVHPMTYDMATPAARAAVAGDYMALTGMTLTLVMIYVAFRESGICPRSLAMALFGLLMALAWHPHDWLETLDYARIGSPLLLLLALRWLDTARWKWALPLILVLPRMGLEMGSQIYRVMRGLL